jgi:hypothetical protein
MPNKLKNKNYSKNYLRTYEYLNVNVFWIRRVLKKHSEIIVTCFVNNVPFVSRHTEKLFLSNNLAFVYLIFDNV